VDAFQDVSPSTLSIHRVPLPSYHHRFTSPSILITSLLRDHLLPYFGASRSVDQHDLILLRNGIIILSMWIFEIDNKCYGLFSFRIFLSFHPLSLFHSFLVPLLITLHFSLVCCCSLISRVAKSVQCLATGWTTGRSRFNPRHRRKDFSSKSTAHTSHRTVWRFFSPAWKRKRWQQPSGTILAVPLRG
jgi:hypothetical protein